MYYYHSQIDTLLSTLYLIDKIKFIYSEGYNIVERSTIMLSKFSNLMMVYLISSSLTLCAMEQELKPNSNIITSAITLYKLEDKTVTETLNEDYNIPYEYNIAQDAGGFSLPVNFQGKVSINNIKSTHLICLCCCSIKNEKRFVGFIHAHNEKSFSRLLYYLCKQKIQPQTNDILAFHARAFPLSAAEMVELCPTLVVKKSDIAHLTIKPDNFQLCTLNLILDQTTLLKYKATTKNELLKSVNGSNNDTSTTTQNSNSRCITS